MRPIDFVPVLVKCGDILFQYLKKHLTDKQISGFLKYLKSTDAKEGQNLHYITEQQGQPVGVYNALVAFARINNLCDAADSPGTEQVKYETAFRVAISGLLSGIVVGGIADEKQIRSLQALARHGEKFALSVGRREDEFTRHLRELCRFFHDTHGKYPSSKEVMQILEKERGRGFIHTVQDDGTVEWGKEFRLTGSKAIEKRLTKIRKNPT